MTQHTSSSATLEKLPYRLGVGLVLMNNQKKVFVGSRINMRTEAWQFPQGGIDQEEDPEKALYREALEEIGTDHFEIIGRSSDWLSYDLPSNLVPNLWQGRYRGQKQKWYLAQFLGEEKEIQINTAEPEFKEWKWIDFEDALLLAAPFKIDLYKQLIKEFRKHFK